MARHGFGRGEYKYFDHPAARSSVATLRAASSIRRWRRSPIAGTSMLGVDQRYPRAARGLSHRDARRPDSRNRRRCCCNTGPDDFNCLHQDIYGEHVFPLQVTFLLSAPGDDFTGGEFVLTEQRPRMQSRAEVVPLRQGEARDLSGAPPPGAGRARRLSRQHAPRRQPAAQRPTTHPRRDLPRRQVGWVELFASPNNRRFEALGLASALDPTTFTNRRLCHIDEGRGLRRALRSFDACGAFEWIRSPCRPCRRRPASPAAAAPSSGIRRPSPRW